MPRDKNQVQYTSEWLPESKYYGDKFPRTLEEAFGHGARLDQPDRRHWLDKRIGVICSVGIVAIVAALKFGWL